MRIVNYIFATGLGTGYSPVAPGTAGSLLALAIVFLATSISSEVLMTTIFLLFWIGIYTGNQLEKEKGKDPSLVVIDEIVGMMISLLYLPHDWRLYLIAFFLFRIFDIIKPFPANRSQKLKGGWGIMIDDVFAGLYALGGTHLIRIILF